MKVTHYFKDGCHIYWRVECVAAMNGDRPEWEVKVFRSLEDFDDQKAHEAFHTSVPRFGNGVDTSQIAAHMGRYYMGVLLGMAEFLQGCHEPLIEPDASEFSDED